MFQLPGRTRRTTNSTGSPSGSSQLSTHYFEGVLDKLKGCRFRRSTRKNYYKIWKLFNNFFIRLDQKSDSWEHRLVLYVTYLIHIGRESQTISYYISAIRAVLLTEEIEISRESFTLTALVKACKMVNNKLHVRLRITGGLLKIFRCNRKFYTRSLQKHTKGIVVRETGMWRWYF